MPAARRRLRLLVAWLLVSLLGTVGGLAAQDQADSGATGRAVLLDVSGAIGPATADYLARGIQDARSSGARLVIIRMDTPGGLVDSTRRIVQAIRASTVPVATWVAPSGARAASAGTYILYASHVAAMAPATNVGAATPISIGGMPGSPEPKEQPADPGAPEQDGGSGPGEASKPKPDAAPAGGAETRKAVNDAAAWIRSLAQETGRNADWAERAVREAVSLTSTEAVQQNVADFVAGSLDELLDKADGRRVQLADGPVTLATKGLVVEEHAPDWRSELLAVITNPTVAYLLMMIGIYGLLLEGYNPGSVLPGTVGAISLLLALYAFQVLPVNYAGLLLIALGIILIVSEAFVPSFGALGIGGIVSMVTGSVILMDTQAPGFGISLAVIGAMALFSSVLMAGIVMLAVQAWRRPVVSGAEEVIGAGGEAITEIGPGGGAVHALGERWSARSERPIAAGTHVRINGREGLTLTVEADAETER